jgi:phosphopyruvate hydratase
MSNHTVLVTDYAWPSLEIEREILGRVGAELLVAQTGEPDELVALAPRADAILTNSKRIPPEALDAASRCLVVSRFGTGVDNIPVARATELGIVVTNVPAFCVDEVSDHAMALILACARQIVALSGAVREGHWSLDEARTVHRLRGQTLGLVGFGAIARALIPRRPGFDRDARGARAPGRRSSIRREGRPRPPRSGRLGRPWAARGERGSRGLRRYGSCLGRCGPLALWRSLTHDRGPLLPLPMVNVVSGGAHAGALIDIQDVLVVPVGASSFGQAIEWAARVRAATAEVLSRRGHQVDLVADEGALAAPFPSNLAAVEAVAAGIEASGLRLGEEAAIALEIAATQFFDGTVYRLASEHRNLSAEELVVELQSWCSALPIVSIEDPLAEDDFAGWTLASRELADRQLLGDDLFVTSTARLADGIAAGIANAVLVKPNQVGTLSDALRVVEEASTARYATVLSARSGETEDAWLSDLAVGWRTGQLKVGSTTRSERTAKWNRLLQIEAEYPQSEFAGREVLAPRG